MNLLWRQSNLSFKSDVLADRQELYRVRRSGFSNQGAHSHQDVVAFGDKPGITQKLHRAGVNVLNIKRRNIKIEWDYPTT